jgi:hypothetical protein
MVAAESVAQQHVGYDARGVAGLFRPESASRR